MIARLPQTTKRAAGSPKRTGGLGQEYRRLRPRVQTASFESTSSLAPRAWSDRPHGSRVHREAAKSRREQARQRLGCNYCDRMLLFATLLKFWQNEPNAIRKVKACSLAAPK